jgi:hypothetical protein
METQMANTYARTRSSQRTRKGRTGGLLLLAVVLAAVGVAAWSQLAPRAERNDPNVVVNLTSMMGKEAPAFTLANSEGETHTVTPGDGRKYLLIFHMGSV